MTSTVKMPGNEMNEHENENLVLLVDEFRNWILKNSLLTNCRVDDAFLKRFVRKERVTLIDVQNSLIRYLHFRQSLPQYILKLDCEELKIAELIHEGYLFPSPILDSFGRRVLIGIGKKLDKNRFNNLHMGRVHALTYETLLENEDNQIRGFQHFGDLEGLDFSYSTFVPIKDFHLGVHVGQKAFPMKHCQVHFINMNPTVKVIYDFFKDILSEKIKQRIKIHSSLEALHDHLEKKCLPKEYGGDIPIIEMIELWKKELKEKKAIIASMDHMRCSIPRPDKLKVLEGNFRKLDVD